MVRCRALSSEESWAPVILLANPDRRDACRSIFRGSQRRGRTGYASNPCICGHAEPPNLLLQIVGTPEDYTQQVHIRDMQIGVAASAL